MIEQLVSNWVCWSILLVALVCYHLLWSDLLRLKQDKHLNDRSWLQVSAILSATLPLLGLLGTILGLLDTFDDLSSNQGAFSGGIADALLTTQMGLLCAIPAWLIQSYLNSSIRKQDLHNLVAREV